MVFGFFTRCPLDDPREKAWTELRMQWLSEQFGLDALRNAQVLLPTLECFPEPYTGTADDAERILRRLCVQYGIPASRIRLTIHEEHELPDAAGTYSEDEHGVTTIALAKPQLENPQQLIATLAHELAHRRLLGERRLTDRETDHEYVTDLLPVYFGAGIFGANDTVKDSTVRDGTVSVWRMQRQGYLPSRMFGYAFALFAWIRDEHGPAWAGHLRKDARGVLHDGLKYLNKTGDSLFSAETAGRRRESGTVSDWIEELRTGNPSRQIAALWELQNRGESGADAIPAVVRTVRSRSPMVRATALETLPAVASAGAEFETEIRPLLQHAHPTVRCMASQALVRLSVSREEAAHDVALNLNDSHPSVLCWTADALRQCGPAAAVAEAELLAVLKRGIVKHHDRLSAACVAALSAFLGDEEAVRGRLREAFPDPEIHTAAIDVLRDLRESDEPPLLPDAFNLGNQPGTARLH